MIQTRKSSSINQSFNLCIKSLYFVDWYRFFVFRRSIIKFSKSSKNHWWSVIVFHCLW